MYTLSDIRLGWSGKGPLFESESNAGSQNGAAIRVLTRPLRKSGLQPLDRYDTHQETISKRPEWMYEFSI